MLFKLGMLRLLWTQLRASELHSVRAVVWEIAEQSLIGSL